MDANVHIAADDLRRFCEEALVALDVPRDHASIVAESLVDADLRGLDAHGVPARLPNYVGRLRGGGIVPRATFEVVADLGAVATLDAGDGFGQVAAKMAMELAIERAGVHGIGVVGTRRSNHLGAVGYWTRLAPESGMVGFAVSGAASRIAAWGGTTPLLSTNPWSFAYPTGSGRPPMVVDVANGAVLGGALVKAKKAGEKLPLGWALDPEGRPTEDPDAALAGSLLPFGGAKGGALNLAMEVLGSVVTGAAYSRDIPDLSELDKPQRLGHLFLALPVADFQPLDEFTSNLDELLGWIDGDAPAEGFDEVRIPGERGERLRQQRLADGIPLGARVEPLNSLAEDLGIPAVQVG